MTIGYPRLFNHDKTSSIIDTHLVFATPRKLPRARNLDGRVAVLDLAFASDGLGGGFEKMTLPLIRDLDHRLAVWVDHHDHAEHARYQHDDHLLDSQRGGAADDVGGFGGIRGLRRGGDPGGGGGLGGLGHGRPSLAAGQLRSRAGPGSAPPTGSINLYLLFD